MRVVSFSVQRQPHTSVHRLESVGDLGTAAHSPVNSLHGLRHLARHDLSHGSVSGQRDIGISDVPGSYHVRNRNSKTNANSKSIGKYLCIKIAQQIPLIEKLPENGNKATKPY